MSHNTATVTFDDDTERAFKHLVEATLQTSDFMQVREESGTLHVEEIQ